MPRRASRPKVVGGQYLVLTAPETEQSFSLRYTLTNDARRLGDQLRARAGHAGCAAAAAVGRPISRSSLKEIAGKKSITVDIFDGFAFNPSGPNSDLVVSLEGPNAGSAELVPDAVGQDHRHPRRAAPGDRLPGDERAGRPERPPPSSSCRPPSTSPSTIRRYIDPTLPDPVRADERDARVEPVRHRRRALRPRRVDPGRVVGHRRSRATARPTSSTRTPSASRAAATTAARRRSASPSPTAHSKDDPKGNTVPLTLPIVVGDPEFRDTPPDVHHAERAGRGRARRRRSTCAAPPGTRTRRSCSRSPTRTSRAPATEADRRPERLRAVGVDAAQHPEGHDLRARRHAALGQVRGARHASTVTVVGSTRAAARSRCPTSTRPSAATVPSIASPLVNDSNPYQTTGEPLTIVDARGAEHGRAGLDDLHRRHRARSRPSPTLKSGTIVVIYTIQDATEDPDRRVNGTITVVVSDVPDQVQKPDGAQRRAATAPATIALPGAGLERQGRSPPTRCARRPPSRCPTSCAPPALHRRPGLTNGTSVHVLGACDQRARPRRVVDVRATR